MGDECQARRHAEEIETCGLVRGPAGRGAGPVGVKNRGHYDPQGVHIPAFWAEGREIFAGGRPQRLGVGHPERRWTDAGGQPLDDAPGRGLWPSTDLQQLGQSMPQPEAWNSTWRW
jgi:hypothetical protein